MALQTDNLRGARARKNGVRFLFLAFVVYFVVGMILRKAITQPYPGLFMPGFPGIGLAKMAEGQGEMDLVRITLRFRDQSVVETTPRQLFGDDFYPSVLVVRIFAFGGNTGRSMPSDVTRYFQQRMQAAFPHREVDSMTFEVLDETFPLNQPKDRKDVGVKDQRLIVFPHENAG